jgi:hypothetical protein
MILLFGNEHRMEVQCATNASEEYTPSTFMADIS